MNSINRLVSVAQTQYVLCEVRTEYIICCLDDSQASVEQVGCEHGRPPSKPVLLYDWRGRQGTVMDATNDQS
jgi:hypothetical protein